MATWREADGTWVSSDGDPAPERVAPPSAPPDRYRDGEILGEGGLGRVIATHDELLDRTVARKVLLRDLPSHRERFVREARITAHLDHPSIVPVYEMGTTPDGAPWYTMKRVEGEPLSAALKRANNLDERLALVDAVLRACQAVAYAHERRVIHRDLKPDNLLLGRFGETWVVDWGLARSLDDAAPEPAEDTPGEGSLTRAGAIVGTPRWMSPEQASGELASPASDVWSLGAVLYAVLTGGPPFPDRDLEVVLRRTRTEAVRRVSELTPDAPRDLAAVAEKALALDPADRYPDAKALADELVAWTSGRRVAAFAYSPLQILRQEAWQHRWLLASLAAAILALTAGLAEVNRRERAGTQRTLEAERREREVTGRALAESLASSGVAALREGDVLLAGAHGAVALRYADLPEARGLVARALASGAPRPLELLDAGFPCRWIQVTPDGRTVICGGDRVVAFRDGARRWELPGPALDGQLSPDGAKLVVGSQAPAPSVRAVSVEDGSVTWQRERTQQDPIAVGWLGGQPLWSDLGTLHTPDRDAFVCTSTITDLAVADRLHVVCVSGAWSTFDPATLAVVEVSNRARGVAFSVLPDRGGTWVPAARSVGKLDPLRGPVGPTFDAAGYAGAMALTEDGRWLAISTDRSVVRWIDLEREGHTTLIPTGAPRAGVAFRGEELWTSGTRGPVRWSPPGAHPLEATRDLTGLVPVGPRRVVVSTASGRVDAVDRVSGERTVLLPPGPQSVLHAVGERALCLRLVEGRVDAFWIGPEGAAEPGGEAPLGWSLVGTTAEGTLVWRNRQDASPLSTVATDLSFVETGRRPGFGVAVADHVPIVIDGTALELLSPTTLEGVRRVPLESVDGAPIPPDARGWVGTASDGRWWFGTGRMEGLVSLDPRDGTVRWAAQAQGAASYEMLRDGRLALGEWDGTVRIVDGGRTVAVLPGRGARASQVVELGDGQLVLTDWEGQATTWDLSALEQSPEELWQRVLSSTGFDWVDGRMVRR